MHHITPVKKLSSFSIYYLEMGMHSLSQDSNLHLAAAGKGIISHGESTCISKWDASRQNCIHEGQQSSDVHLLIHNLLS